VLAAEVHLVLLGVGATFPLAMRVFSLFGHQAVCASRACHRSLVLAACVAVGGFAFSGCTTTAKVQNTAPVVHQPPEPILVAAGRALQAAEACAQTSPNCYALLGQGNSMEPLYPPGTAVVVHEQSFFTLRPGMAVIYRGSEGHCVAHVLIKELRDGWSAQGLNNCEPDRILVTRENLLGVITAAYTSSDANARDSRVGRISAQGTIDQSPRVAASP
jgi:hypothetical protein